MKINAVSGFFLSVSGFTILALLCVVGVFAKQGCSAFGHSCFGGHGKRFDPQLMDLTFQGNEVPTSENFQETDAFRLPKQFVIPREESRGQHGMSLPKNHRQASKFDLNTFSFMVRQWLMSYQRLHQSENELNNK